MEKYNSSYLITELDTLIKLVFEGNKEFHGLENKPMNQENNNSLKQQIEIKTNYLRKEII